MNKSQTNFSILLLTVFLFHSCNEKKEEQTIGDSYTVSGTIKGLDTEFMTYSYEFHKFMLPSACNYDDLI